MTTIPPLPFSGQQLRNTLTSLDSAIDGKETSGTAAAAVAAHLAAADPHPTYLTQTEAGALYAPLASVHDPVTLGATVADVLGLTGQQLTADDPGAGADRLVFWDHSAGRLRHLALGTNLTITDTTIDAAGGTGGYPAFSAPTGFSVAGSGTASITLSFATGYSLPTTASQASWDTAAGLAATAVQPAALSGYVQTSDSRLTDSREWSAATVTQAAAEAGTETERRAWTVQRVWQAAAAWWQSISGATGQSLAGAATPAAARTVLELGTAATTDATAYATASHNQAGSTITGAYTAAGLTMATARFLARWSSGSGAAEEGSFGAGLSLSAAGVLQMEPWFGFACSDESTAITTGTSKLRFRMPFACTLLAVVFEARTAPTGSAAVFDLNEAGTSVFSTNPRIDAGGNDSSLSGTPAAISYSSIAAGAVMTVDFDQVGATVAGAGIKMWINVRRTA